MIANTLSAISKIYTYIYIMQANTKSKPQVYIDAGADITLPQNY
jgi:hypothetical protein